MQSFSYFISLLLIVVLASNNATIGQEWDLINPNPTYEYIQGVDFINNNTGIICGYYGEIFKTENDGLTWEPKESTTCKHLWSVAFINADTGFAVGNVGTILKTIDAGETWIQLPQPVPTDLFYICFYDELNGWIAGTYNTIIRTRDGGNNWEVLSHSLNSPETWYNIDFINRDTGYVVGDDRFSGNSNGLIKRTFNGGEDWENINTPDEIEFIDGLDVIKENEIWIGSGNQIVPWNRAVVLYHSLNGGKNWDTITLGHYIAGVSRIKFFPDSVGRVLCGNMMFITNDGGKNWENNYLDYHTHMNEIDWIDENKFVTVGINGYIFKSNDSGYSWEELSQGGHTSFHDIVFSDEQHGYAIGHLNGNASLYTTSDNGLTWDNFDFGSTYPYGYLYSIDFSGENTGWIAGINGIMFNTNDGGKTWLNINSGHTFSLNDIECYNENYVWAGGWQGKLIKSIDYGNSWTDISLTEEDYNIFQLLFTDPLTGYLTLYNIEGYDEGKLLKTLDGGVSWKELNYQDKLNYRILCMDFIDAQNGFISIKQVGIKKTNDGGETWLSLGKIENYDMDYIRFFDELNGVVAYSDQVVAGTVNGGESWTIEYEAICSSAYAAKNFFRTPQEGWVTGSYGRIQRYYGVYTNINENGSEQNNSEYFTVYPNPSSDILKLPCEDKYQRIMIFDFSGKCVKNIEKIHDNYLDISDLDEGTYILRLIDNKISVNVTKFIKMP